MKIAEIRELTTAELAERIQAEKVNLNQLRVNHAVSPLDSPAKINKTRKLIAKLQTVLGQREQK